MTSTKATPTYRIETRQRDAVGAWQPWTSEGIGESTGWPTREAAERAAAGLPALGPDWAAAEYRVVEELSPRGRGPTGGERHPSGLVASAGLATRGSTR